MKEPRRILVVDDDDTFRELVEATLGDEGYAVDTAPNGLAALEVASRFRPHLILLDLRMPLQDGPSFIKAYRKTKPPRAAVAVVSAVRDPVIAAARIGADAFLAKPFDLGDLIHLVARLSGG